MSVLAWWAVAAVVVVLLARLLDGPVQRGRDALARRRLAGLRAEALLWAWLSAEQRAQYRARGWFEVTTAAGRRYRIRPGGVMGLEPRRVYYCIEATSPVPVADEMLATSCCWKPTNAASWRRRTALPTSDQAVAPARC